MTGIRSPIKICAVSPFKAIIEGLAISAALPELSIRLNSGFTKNLYASPPGVLPKVTAP